MMTIKEERRATIRLWMEDYEKFSKLHPNHCRQCGGWGWESPLISIKQCSECVDNDICPLCGGPLEFRAFPLTGLECTDAECGWTSYGNQDGMDDPPYNLTFPIKDEEE